MGRSSGERRDRRDEDEAGDRGPWTLSDSFQDRTQDQDEATKDARCPFLNRNVCHVFYLPSSSPQKRKPRPRIPSSRSCTSQDPRQDLVGHSHLATGFESIDPGLHCGPSHFNSHSPQALLAHTRIPTLPTLPSIPRHLQLTPLPTPTHNATSRPGVERHRIRAPHCRRSSE